MSLGMRPAQVDYAGEGFGDPTLDASTGVMVRPHDLVRTCVYFGHPWTPTTQFTLARAQLTYTELVHRGTLIRSFLSTPGTAGPPSWVVNEAYLRGLESSEKRGVSYSFGMAFAAVVAGTQLKTPWILHNSIYGSQRGVLFERDPTTKRAPNPDLLLMDPSATLHVMEAKGRSEAYQSTQDEAMRAAERLAGAALEPGSWPVGGRRVASCLFVQNDAEHRGQLLLRWKDPVDGVGAIDHRQVAWVVRAHYARIRLLLDPERRSPFDFGSRTFQMVASPELDIDIGLDESMLRALAEGSDGRVLDAAFSLARESHDGEVAVGPDGIIVRLGPSWSHTSAPREG
jgi:hypothetical protein